MHGARPAVGVAPGRRRADPSRAAARAAGCPGPACPAIPGSVMPSASAMKAIVDAVPIVLQCPRLRIIDDSERRKSSSRQRPGADLLAQPPHVGAAAERRATERAGEHRPAGDDDRREVDRGGRHEQRGDRLVAAARAARPRRSGWRAASPRWPSPRGCARASPSGRTCVSPSDMTGRFERDAAGLPDPLLDARRRPRRGGRCRGSGRRRCWRWRCAVVRRRRPAAGRDASRPGGCRRCGPYRRTTAGCDGARGLLPTARRDVSTIVRRLASRRAVSGPARAEQEHP